MTSVAEAPSATPVSAVSAGSATKRRPLGQTLIERGLLTEDQLRIALM